MLRVSNPTLLKKTQEAYDVLQKQAETKEVPTCTEYPSVDYCRKATHYINGKLNIKIMYTVHVRDREDWPKKKDI